MARERLARLLDREPDLTVVAQAVSVEETTADMLGSGADVVVVDLGARVTEVIRECASLLNLNPGLAVVIVTDLPDELTMISALAAGAHGFLRRESDESLLREAVRAVASGGIFVDPALAAGLVALATKGLEPKGPYDLTRQQMRVLSFLPKGLSNKEIGQLMGLSEQTVKTHVRGILRKLKVHDRAQAAAFAVRKGFVL